MGGSKQAGGAQGGAEDRASAFAAAATGRPPARPRPSARTAALAERNGRRLWIAIAVGGALLFLVLIRGVFEKTRWTAGPSSQAAAAASQPRAESPAEAAASEPAAVEPDADPCAAIIERDGSTYTDRCTAAPRRPDAAGAREQQRRADEAIRVIEASTPESI